MNIFSKILPFVICLIFPIFPKSPIVFSAFAGQADIAVVKIYEIMQKKVESCQEDDISLHGMDDMGAAVSELPEFIMPLQRQAVKSEKYTPVFFNSICEYACMLRNDNDVDDSLRVFEAFLPVFENWIKKHPKNVNDYLNMVYEYSFTLRQNNEYDHALQLLNGAEEHLVKASAERQFFIKLSKSVVLVQLGRIEEGQKLMITTLAEAKRNHPQYFKPWMKKLNIKKVDKILENK